MSIKSTARTVATMVRSTYFNFYGSMRRTEPILQLPPVVIDPSINHINFGDEIIMHYANKQLNELWPEQDFVRINKTHFVCKVPSSQTDHVKIFCGTNALSTHFADNCNFALPILPKSFYHSMLLLAVGMSGFDHSPTFTRGTQRLLRTILSTPRQGLIHSVRDSNTLKHLNNAGIHNVINTSCVTMWDLTPELCATIPTTKASKVLTTITDYAFDSQQDSYMLNTLCQQYDDVYLWLQGDLDVQRLQSLNIKYPIHLIDGGFAGLQEFVAKNKHDLDYFGTRLHCGIYCLNNNIRSMIVTVDNRADDIARDTTLPTVHRSDLQQLMIPLIQEERTTSIHIPIENIKRWKAQFQQ